MNNPYRQIEILQQALASDKSRMAFLLGAGCPVSIQDDKSKPLIQDIEGLTKAICENLKNDKILDKVIAQIPVPKDKKPTIEDILSRVRLLIEIVAGGPIGDFAKDDLEELERRICKEITDAVKKELPNDETPYHHIGAWIGGIQRDNPVEIFTPNYDLLMESALEFKSIPYFDGFIGSRKAFFDLHSIEHEKLPPRWVRLWKLHGSINWWNDADGNVFRRDGEMDENNHENKQMIYPSHLKYEQSRKMPYLAMQDRLGRFLATGQRVLVTCGYSFADEHLNGIVMQRLSANPLAICFGLLYDDLDEYPEAINCAKKITNLSLLAKDGAFIRCQRQQWDTTESNHKDQYEFCVEWKENKAEIAMKIGDFQILGKFLLNQTGHAHGNAEDNHAD